MGSEPVLEVLYDSSSTEAYALNPKSDCSTLERYAAGRRAVSSAPSFEPKAEFVNAIEDIEPQPEGFVTPEHVVVDLSQGDVYMPMGSQTMFDVAKLHGLPDKSVLFMYKEDN